MIRRPPRSTLDRSSAASDVYKRQDENATMQSAYRQIGTYQQTIPGLFTYNAILVISAVSYTHLRAHETVLDLVCRLLLEKKKKINNK